MLYHRKHHRVVWLAQFVHSIDFKLFILYDRSRASTDFVNIVWVYLLYDRKNYYNNR